MTTLARWLGFVALHTAIVAAYVVWLCDVLPPLAGEGAWLVIAPVTAIAAAVLASMHPIVRRQRTHLARLATLVAGVVIAMTTYAIYLVLALDGGNAVGLALVALVAQVLYGLPLFVVVAVSAKLTSPLLIAEPVEGWA